MISRVVNILSSLISKMTQEDTKKPLVSVWVENFYIKE